MRWPCHSAGGCLPLPWMLNTCAPTLGAELTQDAARQPGSEIPVFSCKLSRAVRDQFPFAVGVCEAAPPSCSAAGRVVSSAAASSGKTSQSCLFTAGGLGLGCSGCASPLSFDSRESSTRRTYPFETPARGDPVL